MKLTKIALVLASTLLMITPALAARHHHAQAFDPFKLFSSFIGQTHHTNVGHHAHVSHIAHHQPRNRVHTDELRQVAVHAGNGQQCGVASWYSAGSRTASGERMNANAMAAAHQTLPFGTVVRVVDQKTGRSVQVRINDRGPFVRGRIIDLTRAAAQRLGLRGLGKVCIARV